jgi:hypothetical protein
MQIALGAVTVATFVVGLAAFVRDYFGAEHVGSIYGLLMMPWGVAGPQRTIVSSSRCSVFAGSPVRPV